MASNSEYDKHNSVQNFISTIKQNSMHPTGSNLYAVEFGQVPILANSPHKWLNPNSAGSEMKELLSYFATEISTPSRNINTSNQNAVGTMYRYGTSTSFSSFNIQFILPKSMLTLTLFERWMQYISNDANQYAGFYDEYCCPAIRIYKMERGSGGYQVRPSSDKNLRYSIPLTNGRWFSQRAGVPQYNSVSGYWYLKNVFPFNVSTFTLSNGPTQLVQINVQFYYERYRWISTVDGGTAANATKKTTQGSLNEMKFDASFYTENSPDFISAFNIDTSTFSQPISSFSGIDWSTATEFSLGADIPSFGANVFGN